MIETNIRFHTLAIAKLEIICIQVDNLDTHGSTNNLQKNNIFNKIYYYFLCSNWAAKLSPKEASWCLYSRNVCSILSLNTPPLLEIKSKIALKRKLWLSVHFSFTAYLKLENRNRTICTFDKALTQRGCCSCRKKRGLPICRCQQTQSLTQTCPSADLAYAFKRRRGSRA